MIFFVIVQYGRIDHVMEYEMTPIENWTNVYTNLFTRNSPYCHLLNFYYPY
jgi:hypothetical protein